MIIENIEQLIGNTPIIKLKSDATLNEANLYVKLENLNLTGSIKIRPAYYMIKEAIDAGVLVKGKKIVEPTSGNTGIALAYMANLLGYGITLVMPETMSVERRNIMSGYNAQLDLT
ncbi:MAG: pyridoxal-phosphate dependent enzyme, partial [Bacilli bacterium]